MKMYTPRSNKTPNCDCGSIAGSTESAHGIFRRRVLGLAAFVIASVAFMSSPVAAADKAPGASPLSVSSIVPMNSGAPLGGIGTGFVEIRPDGAFHEWEILNEGKWSHHTRLPSKSDVQAATPPSLRFFLRTSLPGGGSPQLRRLELNSDKKENNLYSLSG